MKSRPMFKARVARISVALLVSAGVGAAAVPSAAVAAPKAKTTTTTEATTTIEKSYTVATGRKVG